MSIAPFLLSLLSYALLFYFFIAGICNYAYGKADLTDSLKFDQPKEITTKTKFFLKDRIYANMVLLRKYPKFLMFFFVLLPVCGTLSFYNFIELTNLSTYCFLVSTYFFGITAISFSFRYIQYKILIHDLDCLYKYFPFQYAARFQVAAAVCAILFQTIFILLQTFEFEAADEQNFDFELSRKNYVIFSFLPWAFLPRAPYFIRHFMMNEIVLYGVSTGNIGSTVYFWTIAFIFATILTYYFIETYSFYYLAFMYVFFALFPSLLLGWRYKKVKFIFSDDQSTESLNSNTYSCKSPVIDRKFGNLFLYNVSVIERKIKSKIGVSNTIIKYREEAPTGCTLPFAYQMYGFDEPNEVNVSNMFLYFLISLKPGVPPISASLIWACPMAILNLFHSMALKFPFEADRRKKTGMERLLVGPPIGRSVLYSILDQHHAIIFVDSPGIKSALSYFEKLLVLSTDETFETEIAFIFKCSNVLNVLLLDDYFHSKRYGDAMNSKIKVIIILDIVHDDEMCLKEDTLEFRSMKVYDNLSWLKLDLNKVWNKNISGLKKVTLFSIGSAALACSVHLKAWKNQVDHEEVILEPKMECTVHVQQQRVT